MQLFEVQVELVSGQTVWLMITEADAESAKRAAARQIEDIRKSGYYSDETSAIAINYPVRVTEEV